MATHYHPAEQLIGILLSMIGFIPYILAWGVIMKLILNYTCIMQVLTYPYALWLRLFGIVDSLQYSSLAIMNFIDLVLPTVMLADVADKTLVFKLLCMNLGEIVYLAPFLLTAECKNLISVPKLLLIWLVRLFLLVPTAQMLFFLVKV